MRLKKQTVGVEKSCTVNHGSWSGNTHRWVHITHHFFRHTHHNRYCVNFPNTHCCKRLTNQNRGSGVEKATPSTIGAGGQYTSMGTHHSSLSGIHIATVIVPTYTPIKANPLAGAWKMIASLPKPGHQPHNRGGRCKRPHPNGWDGRLARLAP